MVQRRVRVQHTPSGQLQLAIAVVASLVPSIVQLPEQPVLYRAGLQRGLHHTPPEVQAETALLQDPEDLRLDRLAASAPRSHQAIL
jgi:hypothetical protein